LRAPRTRRDSEGQLQSSFGGKKDPNLLFLFRATPANWRHHPRPRSLLDPESLKATRWHLPEHYLPSPPDRRARQHRHWLPALHFPRCDRRDRRQVDQDHQPVTSLNTIAPVGPSGSSPATTYLPSKPDCARSELISCTVACVCLRHDTLGTQRPQRGTQARHHRPARPGAMDSTCPSAAGAACTGKELV